MDRQTSVRSAGSQRPMGLGFEMPLAISALICWVWVTPYSWFWWIVFTPLLALPIVGLIHGIRNWETNIGGTGNLSRKISIGMLCFMVVVLILSKNEQYQIQKDIEPSVIEYKQSLRGQMQENCFKHCEDIYGFHITKPSNWHLFGNAPLNDCYGRCSGR